MTKILSKTQRGPNYDSEAFEGKKEGFLLPEIGSGSGHFASRSMSYVPNPLVNGKGIDDLYTKNNSDLLKFKDENREL